MTVDPTNIQFSPYDYAVFTGCLFVSLGIGVYYAFTGNKTTDDFLMASRSLRPLPVAFSFTATYLSSVSILGYVGEVYGHGLQLVWMIVGNIFGLLLAVFTSIPLLYSLKVKSVNEYLELRFKSRYLRKLALALNCTAYIFYLGLSLYAPTLALDAVTPLSLWVYIPLLGIIVTIYSSLGGLKAVVWTDTFQTVIIICGVLAATTSAIMSVGGVENVWRIASQQGRTMIFDFRPGFHVRHTAINTAVMGFTSFFIIYGFTQSTLQRVSTMPDMRTVRRVLYMNIFGLTMLISLLFLCGLGVFAVYAGCDPTSLGHVGSKDQLLPYFVMDHLGSAVGLPGLFVACLFCGTLSSISSVLNAVAAMVWVDLLSEIPWFKGLEENRKALCNKIITFLLGGIMVLIAFAATTMGGVLQAGLSIQGAINGPLMGTFLLGMMVPQCTKVGAFAGTLSGVAVMACLTLGSSFNGPKTVLLPLSTDECNSTEWTLNSTGSSGTGMIQYNVTAVNQEPDDPHPFYGISYTYFGLTGVLTCLLVGCLVTVVTGGGDMEDVDPRFVFKVFRKFVGKKSKEILSKEAVIEGDQVTKV